MSEDTMVYLSGPCERCRSQKCHCRACRGCGQMSKTVYCAECAKTAKCPHGLKPWECMDCDAEADFYYDRMRENGSGF